MSYSVIFNCIAAVGNLIFLASLTTLTYNKIMELKKPTINNVLFANNSSGCCNIHSRNGCTNEYCFKKNICDIIQLINQSKTSICLALYTLNLSEVENAMKEAYRRGVKIRLVTTHSSVRGLTRLINSGIKIRFPLTEDDSLLHHKFCIVDGLTLLTGSMNWTRTSFTSNFDNIIVTSNKEFVDKYQAEFESLWQILRR